MKAIAFLLAVACACPLVAQQPSTEDAVFAAALGHVRQLLRAAPPADPAHPRDRRELPADAIVVARQTTGGAPASLRMFVDRHFGSVIAEELVQSYGAAGPAPRTIDEQSASGFAVLPLQDFETGVRGYDWQRLNQEHPEVRWVVRVSRPALDSLGAYAVVRYELLSERARRYGAFVKFEKQTDGSWTAGTHVIGALWK